MKNLFPLILVILFFMMGCASIPKAKFEGDALLVTHSPNPSDIHTSKSHPDPFYPYTWYYRTEVKNNSDRELKVIWFEAYIEIYQHWNGSNIKNRTLRNDVFSRWYGGGKDDSEWIKPGESRVCDPNWHGGQTPDGNRVKWAFIAIDRYGNDYYGESIIESTPIEVGKGISLRGAVNHDSLADTLGGIGLYQQAVDAYQQAIKIRSDYAEAYYGLGYAYRKLGMYHKAIEAYKQVTKINPDYFNAYLGLGYTYNKLGMHREAVEAYKQATKIKPDNAAAHYSVGYSYGKLAMWHEAMEAFKQTIKQNPEHVDAHYDLGYGYLFTGDKESALKEYEILKDLNPQRANELLRDINKY
jgi:tetratricopeptide (TPR) repeat protein